MQVPSPKLSMEGKGGASSKLWRSRSLPANSLTRATSNTATATTTRPSALWERRKKGNAAIKVEVFNEAPPPPPHHHHHHHHNKKPRTPYEILQVSPLASQADIKTAYWRSALKYHPDKVPSEHRDASTLLFLEIQSAYSTLKDPLSRARFDLHLSSQSFQASGYHHRTYTPRAHSTSYPYMPRAHPPPSSSSSSPSSPNLYRPRGPNYFTPPSIGRNWETDQCF